MDPNLPGGNATLPPAFLGLWWVGWLRLAWIIQVGWLGPATRHCTSYKVLYGDHKQFHLVSAGTTATSPTRTPLRKNIRKDFCWTKNAKKCGMKKVFWQFFSIFHWFEGSCVWIVYRDITQLSQGRLGFTASQIVRVASFAASFDFLKFLAKKYQISCEAAMCKSLLCN